VELGVVVGVGGTCGSFGGVVLVRGWVGGGYLESGI